MLHLQLSQLDLLEHEAIHIIREAAVQFPQPNLARRERSPQQDGIALRVGHASCVNVSRLNSQKSRAITFVVRKRGHWAAKNAAMGSHPRPHRPARRRPHSTPAPTSADKWPSGVHRRRTHP